MFPTSWPSELKCQCVSCMGNCHQIVYSSRCSSPESYFYINHWRFIKFWLKLNTKCNFVVIVGAVSNKVLSPVSRDNIYLALNALQQMEIFKPETFQWSKSSDSLALRTIVKCIFPHCWCFTEIVIISWLSDPWAVATTSPRYVTVRACWEVYSLNSYLQFVKSENTYEELIKTVLWMVDASILDINYT